MKHRNLLWMMAVCLFLNLTAHAAQLGSIRIVGLDHGTVLHYVASPEGVLAEDFSGAAVEDISDPLAAVENARTLYEYAVANGIDGRVEQADASGETRYQALQEGLYLVYSTEAEPEFNPFLIQMPTVINDKVIYDIEAAPKDEDEEPTDPTVPDVPTDPSDPTDPTAPTEPENPDIPDTGVVQWPKYLLLSVGVLLLLTGVADVLKGRERR